MAAPSVEVKCLDTFAYYPAYLRDYDNATSVLVSYPNGWKKDEWVQLENVRNAAAPYDAAAFSPAAGDVVEAQAKSSDDEPYSWWKATVRTVRGEFYMISYSSWEDEFNEILEKDMLRPFNRNPPIKPADIKKLELALPKDLRDSGSLDVGALNSVLETSGALSVHIDHKKQVLVILGNTVSVKRAQLLAGMAFKHLGEIQRLTERKVKHQAQLESLKQRLNEGHLETFTIHPPELLGLVIGVDGKHIRSIGKMPGVLNVRVDSSKSQVSILAKSVEEAKAAREQLEFVEQRFPILKRAAGRVVGKAFSNMESIQRDSGVVRIRLDTHKPTDDPNATVDLILIGTKETVADALLLLNHHMEFLNTVNQLSQDERDLNDEVRKMNIEAGMFEAEQRGGGGRGPVGRAARGPRQQGSRQYNGTQAAADFPPLPSVAKQPKQAQATPAPAAAASSAPAPQSQPAAQSSSQPASAEERKDGSGRGGRGSARGGRGRGDGTARGSSDQQKQPQEQRQRQPRQQQQQQTAAATTQAEGAVTGDASPSAADANSRRGRGRGGRGAQRGGDAAAPAGDAAAPAAAAAAAATTGDATTPAAGATSQRQPRDRKQNPRRQANASAPAAGAATDAAAPAAAGDAAAAPTSSPDSAKPKRENRRGERRPRQPAGEAPTTATASSASPPAAAATTSTPAPAAAPVAAPAAAAAPAQ